MRIGITGNTASGKSTLAESLREAGFFVLDADKRAHKLYGEDAELRGLLAEEFGSQVLDASGLDIDRQELRKAVFPSNSVVGSHGNLPALERLNKLVHPRLKIILEEELLRAEKLEEEKFFVQKNKMDFSFETSGSVCGGRAKSSLARYPFLWNDTLPKAVFLDAALICEWSWEGFFHHTLLIKSPEELRLKRLMEGRGMSQEMAQGQIDSQMPEEEKAPRCSHLLENLSTVEDLEKNLVSLLHQWSGVSN